MNALAVLKLYQGITITLVAVLSLVALAVVVSPALPYITLSGGLVIHAASALAVLGVFLFTVRMTSRSPIESR
jgi:hypothetical protein